MNCSICYDNLESEFIKLECSHSYCNECFKAWYSKSDVKESCCLCFKTIDVEEFGINVNRDWRCYIDTMNLELSKKENVNKKLMVKYFKRCIKRCYIQERDIQIIGNFGYLLYGGKHNIVDQIIYYCLEQTYIELVYYLFDNLNIKTKTLYIEKVLLGLISNFTYDLDVEYRINLLRYLKNKNCLNTKDFNERICILKNHPLVHAVESEKLELVKYVHEELNVNFTLEALEAAYRNGTQDIIEYLDKTMYINYKNELEKKYNKF